MEKNVEGKLATPRQIDEVHQPIGVHILFAELILLFYSKDVESARLV